MNLKERTRAKASTGSVFMAAWVPKLLATRAAAFARREGVNLSAVLRLALGEYLDNHPLTRAG